MEVKASVSTTASPGIVLCTSTKCEECEKFRPEWLKFLQEFKHYEHEFPHNFLHHLIYNPSSPKAKEQRKEVLKYAEEGKDGYPLLLMYIEDTDQDGHKVVRRWKPYWFGSRIFRTAKALLFSFLIVYKILPALRSVPFSL